MMESRRNSEHCVNFVSHCGSDSLRFVYSCAHQLLQIWGKWPIAIADKEDCIKAEVGCVNFIASLTRVDGCVVLSEGLAVLGFGAEITCRKDPPMVYVAGDEQASKHKLRQFNFSHLGTRHRSMMRYCNANPGSVGFVVSQDGDVRAVTRVGKKLVLWENVRLQDVQVVKQNGQSKRKPTMRRR